MKDEDRPTTVDKLMHVVDYTHATGSSLPQSCQVRTRRASAKESSTLPTFAAAEHDDRLSSSPGPDLTMVEEVKRHVDYKNPSGVDQRWQARRATENSGTLPAVALLRQQRVNEFYRQAPGAYSIQSGSAFTHDEEEPSASAQDHEQAQLPPNNPADNYDQRLQAQADGEPYLLEAELVDAHSEALQRENERTQIEQETVLRILNNAPQAVVVDDTKERQQRRRLIGILIAVSLLAVMAATCMGAYLGTRAKNADNTDININATVVDLVQELFGGSTNEVGALSDPTSPQAQSVEWMILNDTTLVLPLDSDEGRTRFRQRYAMCVLSFATNIDNWHDNTKWLEPISECEWSGLTCDNQGRLIGISLGRRNLSGFVPTEMGVLTDLKYLFLFDNPDLGGTLPSELGNLESLLSFYAQGNRLAGPLPTELGQLGSHLQKLYLSNNKLSGSIPTALARLYELVEFDLSNNYLEGTIPFQFWRLQRLEALLLNDNQLTGTLPTDLGVMIELRNLLLHNNRLTGELLSSHLSSLIHLVNFDVSGNYLHQDIGGINSAPAMPSEKIVILSPAEPKNLDDAMMTNCPHVRRDNNDALTTIDWNDAFLTPAFPGQNVTLPENTNIIVSETVPIKMGFVTIPKTSSLILGENVNGIELEMSGMIVFGQLIAGSETCRIKTQITLTFHGSRPADVLINRPPEEYKGLNVVGGTLSLHGKRFYRTWTRLRSTVEVGEDMLVLQDTVNWQPGQEIVLVTTAMKDSREWHQNEVLTIRSVYKNESSSMVPNGTVAIQVMSPVQYRHVAADGYQAEVGLLSRTIKIQGAADDSEPVDPDPHNCFGDIPERSDWGDHSIPCPNTEMTGYGAHVIIQAGGAGFVEGVELFRVGQTNVRGRYPMHFHLLDECPECYFKDSSVHRSYYRCISVHGTNSMAIEENVAYDVTGFCYFLEDGVETKNIFAFNLAAHVHMILPGDEQPPTSDSQFTKIYTPLESSTLAADVTASGFFITNLDNSFIGNSVSGGWSGFNIPILPAPIGLHQGVTGVNPSSARGIIFDGNTAHSTGWWWETSGGIYMGGTLYYDEDNVLTYNPGQDLRFGRSTCQTESTTGQCSPHDHLWLRFTNTKTYLTPGAAINSWSGRLAVVGYEAYDVGRSVNALTSGVRIDNMLVVCRTGEPIVVPPNASATRLAGDGFHWCDAEKEQIINDSVFRNCGYRWYEYGPGWKQADDDGPDRGCGDDSQSGCRNTSAVFVFDTDSDQYTQTIMHEIMQGNASGISYENCGRRFRLQDVAR